jgi:creatinine amidohydrolase
MIEYHGRHLPLGLDSIKAYELCLRAAGKIGGVVLPATNWAICKIPHKWSIEISRKTEERLLNEVFAQLEGLGFKLVVLLSGHYPVPQVLITKKVADRFMQGSAMKILATNDYELALDIGYYGDHAAMWETSILSSLRPDLVKLDKLKGGEARYMNWIAGADPRALASPELGKKIIDRIIRNLSREITSVMAGAEINNMEAHREWAELYYTRPLQFVDGSLRNTRGGARFDVFFDTPEPEKQSYFVTRVLPLRVDGEIVPRDQIEVHDHQGLKWQAAKVTPYEGFYLSPVAFSADKFARVPMQATFVLQGMKLSPGEHRVSVGLELGGVVKTRVRHRGAVKGKKTRG